jgi:hypothetical protein
MKQILRKYAGPWYKIAQVLILLVIAFFIGRSVWESRAQVREAVLHIDAGLTVLSAFLMIACGVLVAMGWNFILAALGNRISHLRMVRVYFLSELGKYLPGKLWTPMSRILMAERAGIPKVMAVATMGTQMVIQIISAMLAVMLTLPFLPLLSGELSRKLLYFAVIIPAGLIALHPRIFNPILNWLLARVSKVSLQARLQYRFILLIMLYWTSLWFLRGFSVFVLLKAMYHGPLPASAPIGCVGVSTFSWLTGMLAFLVPAGLGVAEGMNAELFKLLFGIEFGVAATIAIFGRLLGMAAEMITIAGIYCLKSSRSVSADRE